MSEIRSEKVLLTTTGSAGSAVGSAVTGVIHGFILDVYLDYHASCPNTADVTIAYTTRGGSILVVSNNEVDGLYHPRAEPVDNTGAVIVDAHDWFAIADTLTVSVAQADALTNCVVAYVKYLGV